MIRYDLKCTSDHSFESWFQSADAFDKLKAAGMVVCSTCGSTEVSKSLMAPSVTPARKKAAKPVKLQAEADSKEAVIAKVKAEIEANSDYVGMNFATEARAIHTGDAPERAIFGEAKPEDAKSLIEDGIPVAPLPFMPTRKTN